MTSPEDNVYARRPGVFQKPIDQSVFQHQVHIVIEAVRWLIPRSRVFSGSVPPCRPQWSQWIDPSSCRCRMLPETGSTIPTLLLWVRAAHPACLSSLSPYR